MNQKNLIYTAIMLLFTAPLCAMMVTGGKNNQKPKLSLTRAHKKPTIAPVVPYNPTPAQPLFAKQPKLFSLHQPKKPAPHDNNPFTNLITPVVAPTAPTIVSTIKPPVTPTLVISKVEPETVTPKITTRFLSNKDNIPDEIETLLKNKKFDKFAMNAYVITNPKVIEALQAVSARGASLTGTLGLHWKNNGLSKLSGVHHDPEEHSKNFAGKGKNGSCCLATSANATNMIYPNGNHETMVVVENDTEYTEQMFTAINSHSPTKQKRTVLTSPIKNSAYGSNKFELNDIVARRIQKVAKAPGNKRRINMMAMNLTDEATADALATAAQSGVKVKLLVNGGDSLTGNSLPELKKIAAAGADVSVFDPANKERRILHSKQVGIDYGDQVTWRHMESTGNPTPKGNSQHNILSIFPNNPELNKAAEKNFEKVEKECVPLKEAIKLHTSAKQDKAKKRKLAAAAKKPAAKKQKTTK